MEQWYYNNEHQTVMASIHFVKNKTKVLQNLLHLNSHQQVFLLSSVLCSATWATGELGVNNCLINPFMT